MGETALMDVLLGANGTTAVPSDHEWAPSAEKVLDHGQLAADQPAADRRAADQRAAERPVADPVALAADSDLDALGDLTFAELARARGLDPDAIDQLGLLPARPGPALERFQPIARPTRAASPARPPIAPERSLPTWPPAGEAPTWSASGPASRGLGPVRSRHRPYPGRRPGRARRLIAIAVLAVVAGSGAAAWGVAHRRTGPSRWDPRVASIAAFVAERSGRPWKHPVTVDFLPTAGFSARFAAPVPGPPGPIGTAAARYAPQPDTVYVDGPVIDVYRKVALAGQLGEALQAQYGVAGLPAERAAAAAQAAYVRALPPVQDQAYQAEVRAGG